MNKPGANGVWAGVGSVVGSVIALVFAVEGGYVNHPKDPGGATNYYGITGQAMCATCPGKRPRQFTRAPISSATAWTSCWPNHRRWATRWWMRG